MRNSELRKHDKTEKRELRESGTLAFSFAKTDTTLRRFDSFFLPCSFNEKEG